MKVNSLISHNHRHFDKIADTFQWEIPKYFNLGQDLSDKHADEPSKVAVFLEDEKGKEQKLTFGDLIKYSNKFANVLKGLGVVPGDGVCVILPQKLETVIAHVGIYKLGAIALPLSVLFQTDALEYRLQNSGAKVVVTAQEDAFKVRGIISRLPNLKKLIVIGKEEEGELNFWKALEIASSEFTHLNTKADDPAILIYTSGTTGPPKGALHAHRFLIGHFPSFELSHNFFPKEGDVFWSPADWAWGGGLFDALFPCLHYGVPILAYREGKFDAEKAVYMLDKYRVRNTFIWPTALKMMRQVKDLKTKYSLIIRSISSGGEAVGEEVIKWAEADLGVTINEFFGQTEINYVTGNCSAIMKVKAGSMGKQYPGHTVDLIDDKGNFVKSGEIGEVVVKRHHPVMFLGYWQNEKATQEKILGDWWRMGDLAIRDADGYYWFQGRNDDIIGSAGYRIGPSEIENALLKHPAVAQAAAVGSPDKVRGEIVKAFIKLAHGYSPSDALVKELQEQVKKTLAFYEYPREIEFIDELPMTTTGKVRRNELKRREIEKKKNM